MNGEYERWAEEYRISAENIKTIINELEAENKTDDILRDLYGVYAKCLFAYKTLLRKAKGGI